MSQSTHTKTFWQKWFSLSAGDCCAGSNSTRVSPMTTPSTPNSDLRTSFHFWSPYQRPVCTDFYQASHKSFRADLLAQSHPLHPSLHGPLHHSSFSASHVSNQWPCRLSSSSKLYQGTGSTKGLAFQSSTMTSKELGMWRFLDISWVENELLIYAWFGGHPFLDQSWTRPYHLVVSEHDRASVNICWIELNWIEFWSMEICTRKVNGRNKWEWHYLN